MLCASCTYNVDFPTPYKAPCLNFRKKLLIGGGGIKCLHSNVVGQKLPITPDILHKLHNQLDYTNLLNATFSFGSLIYSLRPWAALPCLKQLLMCDIRIYNWCLMIVMCCSKTIQYRNRTLLVPVPRIEHSKPCPHKAIINTFNVLGVHFSA